MAVVPTGGLAKIVALPRERAGAIVQGVFKTLVEPGSPLQLSAAEADAHLAFCAFVTASARNGVAVESFESSLKAVGVPNEVARAAASLYQQQVDTIRSDLSVISCGYDRIVGCEWRLDYAVSNSESGNVLAPVFLIRLKLEGGKNFDFSCTEEELATLVANLKDVITEGARAQ